MCTYPETEHKRDGHSHEHLEGLTASEVLVYPLLLFGILDQIRRLVLAVRVPQTLK